MNQLDINQEQTREVYAQYGLTMYFAQCLERGLAILLATAYGPGPRKITRMQYDILLNTLFKRTFGALVSNLRTVPFPNHLEEQLQQALEKRNWLTHHYFWDRAGHLASQKGQEEMMLELKEMRELFSELDNELGRITNEWSSSHGVTNEVFQDALEKILKDAGAV